MVKDLLLDLDPGEEVITEVKRHPIGMIEIYVFAVVAILAIIGLLFFLLSNASGIGIEGSESTVIMIMAGIIGLIAVIAYIAAYVYKSNEIVLTNENLIQILQFGLFNRQVSQLNLAKIQDVTVDQVGFFASMFNYGTLQVETAGEAANYIFKFAPMPNDLAKQVIEAHEEYIKTHNTHTYRV